MDDHTQARGHLRDLRKAEAAALIARLTSGDRPDPPPADRYLFDAGEFHPLPPEPGPADPTDAADDDEPDPLVGRLVVAAGLAFGVGLYLSVGPAVTRFAKWVLQGE